MERADIVQAREEWRRVQDETPCEHLVFLDESGAKTNMTRLYGRAPLGERCFDHAPDGRWKTVTMLSSIRLDGTTECLVFAGALDRCTFEAYVKESLAPALKEGDVVVMDNLRAHKSPTAQQAIAARGARVLFLPAYSPDLNPIEKMWSKVKQLLRGLKAWNDDELFTAIGQALDKVTASDAKGWFAACGYSNFQS